MPCSKSSCQGWAGSGRPSTTRQAEFRSICANMKRLFCQKLTKASLLTRPMMTLVGMCLLNSASTSAVLATMSRLKCRVTTRPQEFLAPEAARTFSRHSCSDGGTLILHISGWPPRCVHGFLACHYCPWGGTAAGSATVSTSLIDLRTAQVYCDPIFWSARKCI